MGNMTKVVNSWGLCKLIKRMWDCSLEFDAWYAIAERSGKKTKQNYGHS